MQIMGCLRQSPEAGVRGLPRPDEQAGPFCLWHLDCVTTGRAMRKYIPEKMDFRGTMRFQHVELGREGFVGGRC